MLLTTDDLPSVFDSGSQARSPRPTVGRERRRAIYGDAMRVLRRRYAEPQLTADDLALEVFTSRRQLQRAFKEAGTSFRAELCSLRMRTAASLLQQYPEMSVQQVGLRVGYRQAAQFAKAFRRAHSMTPTAWRATCQPPLQRDWVAIGAGTGPSKSSKEEGRMEVPKDQILELLRNRGDTEKAEQADQELPDQVDPERDSGLLSKLGIEPAELLGKFGGGKIPGL